MKKKVILFISSVCLLVLAFFVVIKYGVQPDEDDSISKYNVVVTVSGDGQVEGSGEYEQGEVVEIEAISKLGSEFYMWSDGETAYKRYLTVTEDVELTAIFKKGLTYTYNGSKIRAFGENIVFDENSHGIIIKSLVQKNGHEYEVQGDWYQLKNGKLSDNPVSDYSYLQLNRFYTQNDYVFIEKEVEDYLFIRFPTYKGTHSRVGTYEEVIAGSNGIFSIKQNATKIGQLGDYTLYDYTVNTNLDASNLSEEMYVYVKYNNVSGYEYRFVYSFMTYSLNGSGMSRDFYLAIGDRLIHVTVNHA